ncbi:hephaestin-like protein [Haliotis cracherodii]|uniref:hephaestin-like protein n=1 Tax=Haliotis cracherodii TaxID=6455 RepID=UPI0039E7F094
MECVKLVSLILIVLCCTSTCFGAERVYYIACSEEVWDYAPGGEDLVNPVGYGQESSASVFLNQSSNRIGHKYKKAIYREYTDSTFTIEKPKPVWLGSMGPVLKAETGDTIVVHFRNNATRTFSMHPHGVHYDKAHEGALYADGTHDQAGATDIVPPRQSHTYNWTVPHESSPAEGDPDCLTWVYHSHVSPVEDISSGLVGFLLTCRNGTLERWEKTRLYAVFVSVFDENLSWYLDDNIKSYTTGIVDKDDEDFQESNKMHAINGYVYGHLPGLSACEGETIHWHMASLGTETDVHALAVSGHSFKYFNHRQDSIRLTVAQFVTAEMTALTRGKWLMRCQVNDHISAGMEAFLTVDNCNAFPRVDIRVDNIRRYYIAAEEEMWDYAPSGRNKYDGGDLTEEGSDSEVFFKKDSSHIGGVYKKALFKEYTDCMFNQEKTRDAIEAHLGFLGPVIRAEVGDLVKVVFYNKASRAYSIHPHGVQHSKLSEGSLYNDGIYGKYDDYVLPKRIRTYYWTIPEEMGPTPEDPPCLTRIYTSGVDVIKDSYSGLVGPMLICRKGSLDESGNQINVTKDFFLMFSVSDENKSWYLEESMNISAVNPSTDRDGDEFIESNLMHGINGRLYGNLDGLDMCAGGMVRWHVFSVGTEVDLHTLTFNGDNFMNGRNQKSASDVLPGSMKTLNMIPRHPGSWGLVCRTNDHYTAGTKAIYNVMRCGDAADPHTSLPLGGQVVRKFIQVMEIPWDYIPEGKDLIQNEPFTKEGSHGATFVSESDTTIGGTYIKAQYQEYTDDTFSIPVMRAVDEEYLGLLGPIIRLEVGDVLEIVFKNGATKQNYTIRAHGLHYNSDDGNFSASDQPSVPPMGVRTFTWNVTESDGPGPSDPECVARIYYSDVNPVMDVNSGLVGPLVVCRKGALKLERGKRIRRNVDADFALYFSVIDENQSWYLDQNILNFAGNASAVNKDDDGFIESNLMHAINGYLYGNHRPPHMMEGQTVDWYLLTLGTEVDMHSVHFHGNDITHFEDRPHTNDVTQLFPSVFASVRMHAVNVGKWLYHCHVHDHIHAGMMGMYEVEKDFWGAIGSSK